MTRALEAAKGLVTPPPLQHWLNAVLLLCVSLVHSVAATLGMWLGRKTRECHTHLPVPALPQAKPDIQPQETNSAHGVILGLVPRISVGAAKGLATDPLETSNQDSRDKPENDSGVEAITDLEADIFVRVPRKGGDPVLRAAQTHDHRSALTRAGQTPAFAGDTDVSFVRLTHA